MHQQTPSTAFSARQLLLSALILTVLFGSMTMWSGLPPREEMTVFLIGVVIFIGLTLAICALGWHLLFRPMPATHRVPKLQTLSVLVRQGLAVLILIATINITVGAVWDEVWHRKFGVPFGEDLFWRPHLMMYTGFGLAIALAFFGVYLVMTRGRGTMQQRFRANPVVGMLTLLGAFLVYALPADPIWHVIYGEDISAWSLPHLVLFCSFLMMGILSAAIMMTTIGDVTWRGIHRIGPAHIIVLLALTTVFSASLQVATTEWDGMTIADSLVLRGNLGRPDWLLPVIVVGLAGFCGSLANHSMRRVGAATVAGLMALAVRYLLLLSFDYPAITANGWLITLPPLVALDAVYLIYLRRGETPSFMISAVALVAGMLAGTVPMVSQRYVYPEIAIEMLPALILFGTLAALSSSWMGQLIGDYIGLENKSVVQVDSAESATVNRQVQLAIPVALSVVIAFISLFIATASPPI